VIRSELAGVLGIRRIQIILIDIGELRRQLDRFNTITEQHNHQLGIHGSSIIHKLPFKNVNLADSV